MISAVVRLNILDKIDNDSTMLFDFSVAFFVVWVNRTLSMYTCQRGHKEDVLVAALNQMKMHYIWLEAQVPWLYYFLMQIESLWIEFGSLQISERGVGHYDWKHRCCRQCLCCSFSPRFHHSISVDLLVRRMIAMTAIVVFLSFSWFIQDSWNYCLIVRIVELDGWVRCLVLIVGCDASFVTFLLLLTPPTRM